MKKMIWMISLLCMAATTGCMQDDPTYFQKPDWWVDGEQDEEGDGEYRLVWSEEFDEEPASGAEYAQPGEKWRFETVHGDYAVTKVRDGMLTITAYKPETPVGGKKYISARMSSRQSWTYGKFEMRAKLPAGRGVWPAFWMLPVTHSDDNLLDGEIDIMEYVGYEPGIVWFSVHNKKDRTEDGKNKLTTSYVLKAPETEFHVYGMEWTPDYIQAYIDGAPYYTFRNDGSGNAESWPFDKAFYLKLNIAVGGDWGGYEGIDDTIFPAEYVIDYVRVYQR